MANRIDYDHLEALAAVVEERTFQRAASRLRVTQSAVSQRIRALEEGVGGAVVERTVPAGLTPLGERLLKHFRALKLLEAEFFSGVESSTPAHLTIGVNADSLGTWFLDAVHGTLNETNVFLELIVENEDYSYRLLQRGTVLGCISSTPSPVPGCNAIPLGKMRYLLCATPAFRRKYFRLGVTDDAVQRAPAILFDRRDSMHERFLRRELNIHAPFPFHFVPTSDGFFEMVRRGHCYGMLPEFQARGLLSARKLVELAPGGVYESPLYWHHRRLETDFQKKVRAAIVQEAKRVLHEL